MHREGISSSRVGGVLGVLSRKEMQSWASLLSVNPYRQLL
mgnify:CR=1 FL=1